jgi:hypothetical protein
MPLPYTRSWERHQGQLTVALREQFRVANLNRPRVNILRDLLITMRYRAEHFLDLRLMRYIGDLSGAHRLQ